MQELQRLMNANKQMAERKKQLHANKACKYRERQARMRQLLNNCTEEDEQQIKAKLSILSQKVLTEENKLREILSIEEEISRYIHSQEKSSRDKQAKEGPQGRGSCQVRQARYLQGQTSLTQSLLRQPLSQITSFNIQMHSKSSYSKGKRSNEKKNKRQEEYQYSNNHNRKLIDEKMQLQEEIVKLNTQIKSKKCEISMLKNQCSNFQSQRQMRVNEILQLTLQVRNIKQQMDRDAQEQYKLNSNVCKLRQQIKSGVRQLNQLREQINKSVRATQDIKQQYNDLQKQYELVFTSHTSLLVAFDKLQLVYGSLNAQMEQITEGKTKLFNELNQTNARLVEIFNTVEDSEEFLRNLNEDIKLQEGSLESALLEHNRLRQEIYQMKQMCREKEQGMQNMIQEENSLIKRINKLKQVERKIMKG